MPGQHRKDAFKMNNTTIFVKEQASTTQKLIVVAGYDNKGNAIEFMDNEDGTWSDLYDEKLRDADFMRRHYPDIFALSVALPVAFPVAQLQGVTL
jgi:hypothetical protein